MRLLLKREISEIVEGKIIINERRRINENELNDINVMINQ